ncbi:MAG: CCA tRNA nucleotidyltransferase [Planctomycetes bacterium]|nr:CCA tRNA nucleotidyltransferase [Planctomycetota bacterium]
MLSPIAQRDFALAIVRKLRAAGFEAMWAGGCVRDRLLGLESKDYDVATSAAPEQIRTVFGRRRTLTIGAAFGVVTVLGPRAAGQIEVATFRTDAAYSDGRHPDSVAFTDAQHDAARRDFTINGLFFDPLSNEIIDYVGGQQDLKQRLVRAIGDPRLRFGEDKLRMLRAVRFAASFGFTIEDATLHAIQDMASEVTAVSAERIGMEIRRILVDPNRTIGLELLRATTLLPRILPEVAALDASAWGETMRVLSQLREPSLPLAMAALLSREQGVSDAASDLKLPAPGSAAHANDLGRRLRYTNKEIDRVAWLLTQLPIVKRARETRWPQLQRILIHDGAIELLALHEAIAGPDDMALVFCRERLAWPAERLNPPPLIDGSDLIRQGIPPGPRFAMLLEHVRDAQLEGTIHSRDEALALADRLIGQ